MKISKKLIEKKDSLYCRRRRPDCYKLNRYILSDGICDRRSSFFQQVADLDVGQLGNSCLQNGFGHNERHIKKDKVGFYGLDVYSSGSLLMRFLNI
jgi:hypothetical protein